jgi:hypothetical protein
MQRCDIPSLTTNWGIYHACSTYIPLLLHYRNTIGSLFNKPVVGQLHRNGGASAAKRRKIARFLRIHFHLRQLAICIATMTSIADYYALGPRVRRAIPTSHRASTSPPFLVHTPICELSNIVPTSESTLTLSTPCIRTLRPANRQLTLVFSNTFPTTLFSLSLPTTGCLHLLPLELSTSRSTTAPSVSPSRMPVP